MSGELAQTFHERFGVSTAQPGLLQLRQCFEEAVHRQLQQEQALQSLRALNGSVIALLPQPQQQIECKRMPFGSWVAAGSNGLLKPFAAKGQTSLAVLLDQRQADQIRVIGHICVITGERS